MLFCQIIYIFLVFYSFYHNLKPKFFNHADSITQCNHCLFIFKCFPQNGFINFYDTEWKPEQIIRIGISRAIIIQRKLNALLMQYLDIVFQHITMGCRCLSNLKIDLGWCYMILLHYFRQPLGKIFLHTLHHRQIYFYIL